MTEQRDKYLDNGESVMESTKNSNVDFKLEVVVIPVSDVDRANSFYGGLGWRLDADYASDDGYFRVIQFTPPGSGCSVIFGKNVTAAAPGSAQGLYLIVSDIGAARDEMMSRGVEISEVFHDADGAYAGTNEPYLFGRRRVGGLDPGASQLPLVRLVPRSGRQRLAVPGDHREIARTRGRGRHGLHLVDRACGRAPTRGGRARRTREADRPTRSELAQLVRRLHRPGAGRHGAAVMIRPLRVNDETIR
jgi:catechol 2,3-dioxygenase-like lactoylglutathione lyase family enzyme